MSLRRLLGSILPLCRDERLIMSSGLFDEPWYLTGNPEAAQFPKGALRHFMVAGARDLRDPNPFFNTGWYCERRPDIDWTQANPVVHYLRHGSAENEQPSPRFDPQWYRTTYPEVALAGFEPLSHYLQYGKSEGRRPTPSPAPGSVANAAISCLKAPSARETMSLFVTHAPAGRIKPHVRPHIEALASQGVATTLIVMTDHFSEVDTSPMLELVEGLYLRKNEGYDFAAWSHVSRGLDLSQTRCLCLVNDSVIGPLNSECFSLLFRRIRSSQAHLVGLTDNYDRGYHFQSYFLVAKEHGVAALQDFLAEVKSYASLEEVTDNCEIPLLSYFTGRNLRGEALFQSSKGGNATIALWHDLVERRFPFVKTKALRQSGAGDWRGVLRAHGYDPHIAERTLAIIGQNEASPPQPRRRRVDPISPSRSGL